jgi:glycosyltransferase involved in cell wall biosynthesis
MPLVSVIIPTRNRAALLRHAIESVLAVGQAHRERFELDVMVIDDGSTDETAEVVAAYPVRFLHTEEAHGASAGRNVGLAAARGDYIAFLDDDDLWLPSNVVSQLDLFAAHPEYGLVFGQAQRTEADLTPYGDPAPEGPATSGRIFERLLEFWPQIGTCLVRAEAARVVGPFDLELIADQDWDWLLRIAKSYEVGWIEEPVILFRQRARSDVALTRKRLPFMVRVFRKNTGDLPLAQRARLERILIRHRGWYASQFLNSSREFASAGDHREARRALRYAFLSSPPHTLYLLLRRRSREDSASVHTPDVGLSS